MRERLYDDEPWLHRFEAHVTAVTRAASEGIDWQTTVRALLDGD